MTVSPAKKRGTIRDVARPALVSHHTVSRVIALQLIRRQHSRPVAGNSQHQLLKGLEISDRERTESLRLGWRCPSTDHNEEPGE